MTLKAEQKVIHLRFHHQPFRMVFKCPACDESLSSDLASNVRKHVATHPELNGEALLNKHIWDLEPVEWSGSDQYGGEHASSASNYHPRG